MAKRKHKAPAEASGGATGAGGKGASKASAKAQGANKLWGGRFASGPAAIMEAINASIGFDRRMYKQDIAASKAHCAMLVQQKIVSAKDGAAIAAGLDAILADIDKGRFEFSTALEDIHMNVEARLAERIGDAAGRLHTARSRNDQVATDFRLWVRDAIDRSEVQLKALQAALLARAEEHAGTIMPGFTHLQTAQPVTFGHHLLAYVEMIGRDRGRFADARARLNENPLGAAALAGTPYPVDRTLTSKALGFARPMENSLDAVSDRDFALEFLAAASICAMHLSRLAEEIVLWCSAPFRFVALSDSYTTGSSIMPQKRNPDAAELVRGKAGRVFGALMALLTMLKGLPLTYSKDMQEDKEPTFEAADTLELALAAMTGMVLDMKPNAARMREVAAADYSVATDLADWLVRSLNLPFRTAHHVTGQLVALAARQGVALDKLALADMQKVAPGITRDVFKALTVEASVNARTSFGGTAPKNVRAATLRARKRFSL